MLLSTLILVFILDVQNQDQYHQSDTSHINTNDDMRPSTCNASWRGQCDTDSGTGRQRRDTGAAKIDNRQTP